MSGFSGFHARGTLKSLENPEAAAWIVYEMKNKNKQSFIDLHTSSRAFRLEAIGNVFYPGNAIVFVNDVEFGKLEKAGKVITLIDLNGYKIGTYHRFDESKPSGLKGVLTGSLYGSVKLKGRSGFNLYLNNSARRKSPSKFERDIPFIKSLLWRPSQEDEDWLMGLVGWEILKSAGHTLMEQANRGLD